MSEQNKPDSASIQLPSVAIVALILGVFVFQDAAFESSRPRMSDFEHSSSEDVRSRLWQDPFEAVTLHRKKFHQFSNEHHHTIVASNESDTYAYQLDQSIQRICHSSNPNISAHSIEELRCQIQRDIALNNDEKDSDFHVLAVMVPGGPYAESKEWRLRSRYALVSGLAATGYKPKDSEHIGFVDFLQACQKALKNGTKSDIKFCDWPAFIPYEWFKPEIRSDTSESEPGTLRKRILVLWLDNGAIAQNMNPLNMLDRLKDGITPGEEDGKLGKERFIKPSFNIIGPHSSTTLETMYNEIYRTCDPVYHEKIDTNYISNCDDKIDKKYLNLRDSLIFSASATIDRDDIVKKIKQKIQPQDFNKRYLNWFDDRIVRTISTHEKLAGILICELALRGVKFFNPAMADTAIVDEECALSKHALNAGAMRKKDHIVLIGERDTVYSRHLTGSIKEKIKNYSAEQGSIEGWVHSFNYLRGIDGINDTQVTSITKNKKAESEQYSLSKKQAEKQLRRPTGSNQFDYLRRLVKLLEELENTRIKQGGIKAIGVLGNDSYDKLLILQALYKRFPQAVFFTTDMDARFLHPAELQWTRNLIVASSYGLRLDEKLQHDAMPFRDGYQTALYLTTKLAVDCRTTIEDSDRTVHCNDSSLKAMIDESQLQMYPRLFEIGNGMAVDLSHTQVNDIHPEPEILTQEPEVMGIILLFAFITSVLLFLYNLVPKNARPIIWVIAAVFGGVLVLYMFLRLQESSILQTFSFTNGTSTWPANAIRFCAFIIAISFFISLKKQLKKSNEKITEKFISLPQHHDRTLQLDEAPKQPGWLSLFFIDKWEETAVRTDKKKSVHFVDLWNCYRKMRGVKYCAIRVMTMLMLYVSCIILLIQTGFFEMPGIPGRGKDSYYTSAAILLLVISTYLILIFVIADITHLSSHFIMLLRTREVIWPQQVLSDYIKKYGASENESLAKNKLLMDLVNRLSGDVNSFIYYPFIILFLLILSRSHYFDNWHYTPFLFMVISCSSVIALGSAIRLRKAAIGARNHFLEKLNSIYWESITHEAQQKNREVHHGIKLLTEEISNLNTGPFQPIGRHPIVLSLLMPLGSVGGLYIIEYFLAAG